MNGRPAIIAILMGGILLLPATTQAYVGPGAGLSLLGALWALIVAVAAAVVFLFAWPIRRMRRRRREAEELEAQARAESVGYSAPDSEASGAAGMQSQTDDRRES